MADPAIPDSVVQPALALPSSSLQGYGLDRVFAFAARAELDGVEIEVDERWDTRHPGYLHDLCSRYHLPVLTLHIPSRPVSGFSYRPKQFLYELIHLAEALNAQTLVLDPAQRTIRNYIDRLIHDFGPLQSQTPVRLVIENRPLVWQRRWLFLQQPRDPYYTLEQAQTLPALSFNTAHFGTAGVDILAAWQLLSGRTYHITLSDYDSPAGHLLPGKGNLPLRAFLQNVAAANYRHTISIALSPQSLGAGDDGIIAGRLQRAANFCRKYLRLHSLSR